MSDIERDIYEVANQLEGYVDTSTPERLKVFLLREGKAAAALADEISRLRAELANARNAGLEEAAEILEMRAANYERISCDVWLTKDTKRSFAAMEEPFRDAASAIRALKKEAK